jgi:carbamoyltransferase
LDELDVKIIGISHPISWNNAACAIDGENLSFFLEEERPIRFKHAPHVFPTRSVALSRSILGEDFAVAVGFQFVDAKTVRVAATDDDQFFQDQNKTLRISSGQADIFRHFSGRRVVFIDHQKAHAYSVIAQNQFEPGLVISIDGWGGALSGLVGRWDGVELTTLATIPPDYSLGVFYSYFTVHCGFRYHSGEGTLMGLAALGKSVHELPETIFDPSTLLPEREALQRYFVGLERPTTLQDQADWALTTQRYFERAVYRLVESHLRPDDASIMLAGGCALNCTANGMLAARFPDRRVVVQPASTDSGTAFGAGVALALSEGRKVPFETPYLGCDVETDGITIPNSLKSEAFDVDRMVDLLVAGDVIGICTGRDEIGPRALCNRSLIAGGHAKTTREKLNQIKRRQWWRPVAPVTTRALLAECLDGPVNADLRFMNVAAPASDSLKEKAASCVHLDGSIRVQVLDDAHPLHPVIEAYHAATGCPALANTSFNIGSEPIVHSFEDAMRTFMFDDRITAMLGGNTLFTK